MLIFLQVWIGHEPLTLLITEPLAIYEPACIYSNKPSVHK